MPENSSNRITGPAQRPVGTSPVTTIAEKISKPLQPGAALEKPINHLVEVDKWRIPELLTKPELAGGKLEAQTKQGPIGLEIWVLKQPPEPPSMTSRLLSYANYASPVFWVRSLLGTVPKTEGTTAKPVPLAIAPKKASEVAGLPTHLDPMPELMYHIPHVVMQDDTHYAIRITAPETLVQTEWKDIPRGHYIHDDNGQRMEVVGKQKEGYAVVVRVNDGEPLMRQKQLTTRLEVYREILGGIKPASQKKEPEPMPEERGKASVVISKRTTVLEKPKELGVGETASKQSSIEEPLIFKVSADGSAQGSLDDKQGKIQVVVYRVLAQEVKELIPAPEVDFGHLLGDTRGLSFVGPLRGGFSAGSTAYGEAKPKKVDISGVQVREAVAAFELVCVASNDELGLKVTPLAGIRS